MLRTWHAYAWDFWVEEEGTKYMERLPRKKPKRVRREGIGGVWGTKSHQDSFHKKWTVTLEEKTQNNWESSPPNLGGKRNGLAKKRKWTMKGANTNVGRKECEIYDITTQVRYTKATKKIGPRIPTPVLGFSKSRGEHKAQT